MKNIKLISALIFACIFLLSACKKDKLKSIDDLEVQIDLLDTNYNSTRNFNYGADMIFRYTETNKTDETIKYYTANCPTFQFSVYNENDSFIGDPIPENWGCLDILYISEIAPKETKTYEINWFNDTTNIPLPVGNYKFKFYNNISIPEIKEHKEYYLTIDFKIE